MSNKTDSNTQSQKAKPGMLTYYLRHFGIIRKLKAQRDAKFTKILRWTNEYNIYHQHLSELVALGEYDDVEVNLYTVGGCTLIEPRQGARVTERQSHSGGRLLIGTKIGPIIVGKSGASKGNSTSITNAPRDELTQVDSGQVTVSTRGISFVGQMFSRDAEFANLSAWKGEEDRITIAESNSQTVWIVDFASEGDMWMAGVLIDAAEKLSDRRLDTSKQETIEKLQAVLASSLEIQESELVEAINQSYADLETTNTQLREFHQKYPGKVADPGPELRFGESTN